MSLERIRKNTSLVETEFAPLNNIQLNWKPADKSWSVGQVLEHIIVSNRKYFELLGKAQSDTYKPTLWEKWSPLSKYTGKNLVKNMGPETSKKYIAPMLFKPSRNMIGQEIIGRFMKMQEELEEFYIRMSNEKYSARVITSPVANLVTLTVADVLELLVSHEERHLNQAQRIVHTTGFPQ